ISALQSALFNQYLTRRIETGTMDATLLGDIAKKQDSGGIFTVENVEIENTRVKAWEISPTGPIYGYKMLQAVATAGDLEATVLAGSGLTLEAFRNVKSKGSRRPLRYRPEGLTWQWEDAATLIVSFFAPKGAYATVLLRELMKLDVTLDEGDED
ncbi:MAG: tRNA pseudouridine(13) synthase TruD, partial [Anaerolineae bacterium]|nr:tRNA pseudouridine(13) synthase TruD [Anaerolineae bacterium]